MRGPVMSKLKRKIKFFVRTLLSILHKVFDCLKEKDSSISSPMEPQVDPKKPAVPISYPLKTLEELQNKSYFESFHFPFNKCSVPLPPSRVSKPQENRPRMLVCHDMQGGYVDDKWVQGSNNSDAYAIWHWHLIDIFVYFSHNLVTLPPPCWTNTAHRHGVQVLGTFITEWEEGQATCKTLLASKESAQMYADRLTELAVKLGFDGWLLNMEVNLDLEQVSNLKVFVDHLTVSMHHSLPGSLVIWYDSVTKDGQLSWQNELNEYNKPFFDICDGIFLNYSWTEDMPKSSALVAGKRQFDVYLGIDVFGRGQYGGGQWTTDVAIKVAKNASVSVAIFAPGWVYETDQKPNFEDANNRWWGLVGQVWPSSLNYPELLPFFSNFDQGHGKGVYIEGQKALDKPWNNISCQSFQPLLEVPLDTETSKLQVFTNFQDDSYNGGACITIKGDIEKGTNFMVKLFQGTIALGNLPVRISYYVKSEENSALGIVLNFSNSQGIKTSAFLAPEGTSVSNSFTDYQSKFVVLLPSKNQKISPTKFSIPEVQASASLPKVSNNWVFKEYNLKMDGYTLSTIYSVSYNGTLNSDKVSEIIKENNFVPSSYSTFQASELLQNQNVTGSSSAIESTANLEYWASLGNISITSPEDDKKVPPSDMWIINGTDISWETASTGGRMLSINIGWKLKEGSYFSTVEPGYPFPRYDLYVERINQLQVNKLRGIHPMMDKEVDYLGVAVVQAFYVSNLLVPSECKALKFILQVCMPSGIFVPLEDSPSFSINVPSMT
ncbi:hypothetical protein SUGI_0758260 [Cryptomeria japonica]|uniref:cytosolic endo-beta-N-acetylglucosaminidase 1 n=1 Tax=Cryptomeria japonica TaxID=3369 RepID=UPI002414ABAB|nr:cytosolic endo-beta-N-acetylglucosaminidase 1 [Cryptomeria japonica]GLJ37366.1 hypothetical protein SUGI_0758260 [Cryptomeria japonica]